VASVRLSGASSPGTGVRLEISGDKGDLVVTAAPGARGIQMADLRLQQTIGMGDLADIAIPEHYFAVPPGIRQGPPLNVGQAYGHLADGIDGKRAITPDFREAAARHRTLDRIEEAARTGERK
jgi:predicted dehydrogenase